MCKVFTVNSNGRIELTQEQLQKLLDEAYWDGYNSNHKNYWAYTLPIWASNSINDDSTLTACDCQKACNRKGCPNGTFAI